MSSKGHAKTIYVNITLSEIGVLKERIPKGVRAPGMPLDREVMSRLEVFPRLALMTAILRENRGNDSAWFSRLIVMGLGPDSATSQIIKYAIEGPKNAE